MPDARGALIGGNLGRMSALARRLILPLLLLCAACSSQDQAAAGASGESAAPLAPGRDEYAKAKDAIWKDDLPRAMELLTEAKRLDPEVCEYWYQLGAAEANHAINIVNDSQSDAVRVFESSVDHKTEALRLMNLGKCPIWNDSELAQARFDAEHALQDAEEVLRDKTSLVQALQMYAAQRGK